MLGRKPPTTIDVILHYRYGKMCLDETGKLSKQFFPRFSFWQCSSLNKKATKGRISFQGEDPLVQLGSGLAGLVEVGGVFSTGHVAWITGRHSI